MEVEKYKCLVVDDEPIARKIISGYIDQMPLLALAAEQINALNAIDYLRKHEVDIIFLDINMPNLSGIQLLKVLQPQQPVIFTTAYAEHAVESYELNAVDYLLKPFSFERFTKAVYKAVDAINSIQKRVVESEAEQRPSLFIKSDGKSYPVFVDEILYCEARKNYTMVVLKNEHRLMPLIPLTKFELVLSEMSGSFIQVHRSFLVNKSHIISVTSSKVLVSKYEIPIGIQFKVKFYKAMGIKENY